jgi:hypothetical protein
LFVPTKEGADGSAASLFAIESFLIIFYCFSNYYIATSALLKLESLIPTDFIK